MKRTSSEAESNSGYEGQKIAKISNESSSPTPLLNSSAVSSAAAANNSMMTKCFPMELGILDEICSFSSLDTQCSLYATCTSIRNIMDGDNFLYHYQSRKIAMLMKEACREFTSEVDTRNFFLGICYRLNAEIAILDKEIKENIMIDKNLGSLFCFNVVKTGNSSFTSSIKKLLVRDSNQYLLIKIDYATFRSFNHLLSTFVISCNNRVLIHYEKASLEEIDIDKCGLDAVLKTTAFGVRGNIQALIKTLLPEKNMDTIYQSLIEAYTKAPGCNILERVDKFGWCENVPSKKGIQFASDLIDKMCKIPKKSINSILKFVRFSANNLSSTRIAKTLQAPSPAFKNVTWCSPVTVVRIFNEENCYEKVEFDIRIRGSLQEKYKFFSLKYECENYTGDDDFVDVGLECYFNNPKDSVYIYQNCSEKSRFDEPTNNVESEYLSMIGKILGNGTNDPINIVKFMASYAMTHKRKLFNIQDYFYSSRNDESGANKKPFTFTNGIEKVEELDGDDIFDDCYY
ncbi:predicted protein [Naegleria gruberi]|uniref:Predicted protein n=1 Tax=Naegleria gruberi TaxID=5762 RepID=D2W341_NAEGR|nr:uncharacterized protein NAEGRDRAFT_54341 [Naegleria gruberi]EFC36548.1 predicted protein [Naegleria gruberi]|eukprot:XP_002669292.1 predicted protein [Naegleria gruberi strain NEG-M]